MSTYIHPRLQMMLELAGLLELAAREAGLKLHRTYRAHVRPRVGTTLRPGPQTPLWNELAKIAAGSVTRYGAKARLARFLGVPRQRVHEYLVAKTAYPDTERALRLLAWLLGQDPTSPKSRATGQKPSVT